MILLLSLPRAYEILYTVVLIVLALLILIAFVRVLIGPKLTDRIVGINMIGTFTILIICVLALSLSEGYLLDIAVLYAMISFLAVVVLTKIYLGVYLERMERRKKVQINAAKQTAEAKQMPEAKQTIGEAQTTKEEV